MVKISKATVSVVIMFVAWKMTDALLGVIYESLDNSIINNPGSAKWLLVALRGLVGFIGVDAISFAIFVLALLFTLFKLKEHD